MSSLASDRYGVSVAPGGLVLVEEVLNTLANKQLEQIDLLGSLPLAQEWLDGALSKMREGRNVPVEKVTLSERDLPVIQQLRSDLVRVYSQLRDDEGVPDLKSTVTLKLSEGRTVVADARGTGAAWVRSTVLLAMFEAEMLGTNARLKVCAKPTCNVAFYDQSKNKSGTWHNFATCGNAINLRAFRERKKSELSR